MTHAGRFAPTPSGRLHLGSARTALAAWLDARAQGQRFVLRVEDLDPVRTLPGATEAMLDELGWLGLDWDEGPSPGGPSGPYLQSARGALYREVLAWLHERGLVYPCRCSRAEVALASTAPHGLEPVYPGTCRGRPLELVRAEAEAAGRTLAWRFAVPRGARRTVHDALLGEYTQNVEQMVGDFVVYRADGVAAYQLAVVVDDVAMGIDSVLRGADLLDSTPRQLLLYEALGAAPPRYAHVPLVLDNEGVRLAKRHGSLSLASLRSAGVQPARLREALARSLGQRSAEPRDFVLGLVPREPASLAMLRNLLPEIA